MQPFAGFVLGQKSLGTEAYTVSSSLSGQAPQHHNLIISTGNQKTNPGEDGRPAPHHNMFLQQENSSSSNGWRIVCSSGHG
jgi:hypothetical protein